MKTRRLPSYTCNTVNAVNIFARSSTNEYKFSSSALQTITQTNHSQQQLQMFTKVAILACAALVAAVPYAVEQPKDHSHDLNSQHVPMAETMTIFDMTSGETVTKHNVNHLEMPMEQGHHYRACAQMKDGEKANLNLGYIKGKELPGGQQHHELGHGHNGPGSGP